MVGGEANFVTSAALASTTLNDKGSGRVIVSSRESSLVRLSWTPSNRWLWDPDERSCAYDIVPLGRSKRID